MAFRVGLFVTAALLMTAHYFRVGNYGLVALSLATPLLFFYRRGWSLILLQLAAYCASASWLGVALALVQERTQIGRPWTAAALILGAVTLLTLAAGLALNSRCLRERYPMSLPR